MRLTLGWQSSENSKLLERLSELSWNFKPRKLCEKEIKTGRHSVNGQQESRAGLHDLVRKVVYCDVVFDWAEEAPKLKVVVDGGLKIAAGML
jgi:hypothetical protein